MSLDSRLRGNDDIVACTDFFGNEDIVACTDFLGMTMLLAACALRK